jgi:hypothetical protein
VGCTCVVVWRATVLVTMQYHNAVTAAVLNFVLLASLLLQQQAVCKPAGGSQFVPTGTVMNMEVVHAAPALLSVASYPCTVPGCCRQGSWRCKWLMQLVCRALGSLTSLWGAVAVTGRQCGIIVVDWSMPPRRCVPCVVSALFLFFFLLVTKGGVTLLAGHTHQPDESDCGGLQHCCH